MNNLSDEQLHALLAKCSLKNPPGSLSGYTEQVMAKIRHSAPAPLRVYPLEVGFALAAAAAVLLLIARPPATAPEIIRQEAELLAEIEEVDRFVIAKAFEEESSEEQEIVEHGVAYDGLYDEELLDTIRRTEETGLQIS